MFVLLTVLYRGDCKRPATPASCRSAIGVTVMVSLLAWKGVLFKAKPGKPTEGNPPNNKLWAIG